MSDSDDSHSILPRRGMPLEEMLGRLERDHARVLVALLMYGTLTAVEEGRSTVDTGHRVVLNYFVLEYFEKKLEPRDRIIEEALSCSIEIGIVERHFGPQAIPRVCWESKNYLAPWWSKCLGTARPSGRTRCRKIILETDIPLDQMLADLDADRSRALIILLLYGALTAPQEGLITFDVAEHVVANGRIRSYCQEKLSGGNEVLEDGVSRCSELVMTARTAGEQDILQGCAEVKADLAQVIGPSTSFMADDGPGDVCKTSDGARP